jgi:hypothetical protein
LTRSQATGDAKMKSKEESKSVGKSLNPDKLK